MNTNIEVLRELDELVEAARLLGVTQAKRGFGCYTDEDSRFERAMRESIDKHRAALVAEQQPTEGEEIMVNTPHGVFTLPLHPSGLSSGPRFVVHVPEIQREALKDAEVKQGELLPLPEGEASSFGDYQVHDNEAMIEYARANVALNTALLRAEIEALRAEVERLEKAMHALEQHDEALLRQALKALESGAWDTLSGRNAAFAIRERIGLGQEEQA